MTLYKYPRTPHLPWSPGRTSDDKTLDNVDHFAGQELVATIKYDGENTTMYSDHIHARSLDSKDHESRHWVKAFHAGIKHLIPAGWRVCGENLFAKHSIHYTNLKTYFYGFSVWDERNVCLDWDTTIMFMLDLNILPVLQFNISSGRTLQEIDEKFHRLTTHEHEGYVIRLAGEFRYEDFERSVAKYVRAGHVQTDKHWMYQEVVPNKLWEKKNT
jgi:hypothetical protein